ncbi:hypothetical protein ABTY98_01140 [Streptomyces sp. NPDC096040]|uniref:hypothetical protein n=1 Tax=Streptomyces sp. NPDC096040 TaxID=3155541 RepID=UPI00332128F0
MGCGCGGNRKRSAGVQSLARPGKTTYEAVLDGGKGRVAFTTSNKPLADSLSGNYLGSVVRPLGAITTSAEV